MKTLESDSIVVKFGGSTFSDMSNLRDVAAYIKSLSERYKNVVVCVSAPTGVSERHRKYIMDISEKTYSADIDALITMSDLIGARIVSHALTTINLDNEVCEGDQIGIYTNNVVGGASVIKTDPAPLSAALATNRILVVPGGQGCQLDSPRKKTWLGKNTSDYTAVLLAMLIKAESCYIHSDVSHIHTCDPNRYNDSTSLPSIGFEPLKLAASLGAKVLDKRAVALAELHDIAIITALNSKPFTHGTVISSSKNETPEMLIFNENTMTVEFGNSNDRIRSKALLENNNLTVFDQNSIPCLSVNTLIVPYAFADATSILPDEIVVNSSKVGPWEHLIQDNNILQSRAL